jgi:hypothetical protein
VYNFNKSYTVVSTCGNGGFTFGVPIITDVKIDVGVPLFEVTQKKLPVV